MQSTRPALSSGGFTLVEILLAISILAIVATTAYSVLNKLQQTRKMLDDQRDATAIANAVVSRLARELQLATSGARLLPPRDALDQPYGQDVHLIGELHSLAEGRRGDSITFVAAEAGQYLPDGLTHSGTVQITYRVERDPERPADEQAGFYLIRDEAPLLSPPEKAWQGVMTFPVTKNLVSLSFRYYEQENNKWVSEWSKERRSLPQLITLTLRLRSPGGSVAAYSTTVPIRSEVGSDF